MDEYISREAAIKALMEHRGMTPIAKLEAEMVVCRVPTAFQEEKGIGGRRMAESEKFVMTTDDFGTLCICAIRYCHGRQTYMPDLVRGIIRPHLTELDDQTLAVMIEDCGFQRRMNLYGDERIDLPGWLTWEQELLTEKKRRAENG